MKLEIGTRFFRITVEFFRLGPEPAFRPWRVVPREATLRRKLLRNVRERLAK